ncbi:MAG: GntR family transcriptional regulator [Actinobacteria bacterium]|nr:GntR family transcriptional regulator [Actinomycetota bacterium]
MVFSSTELYTAPRTTGDSIAERVYDELRRELLIGQIPYGERLVEEALAARFDCSRTPVREALHRLQADGHVVKHPMGGITPQPPQASAMRDLYEVRLVVEGLVVRRAATNGDSQKLTALRDAWLELGRRFKRDRARLETPDFVYADEAFHENLAAAGGNLAVSRYLRDINERIRILRVHDFTTGDRIKTTIVEHIEIADAVLTGEADAAAALMRVHIDRSSRVVEQRVGAMLARMFDVEEVASP